MHGREHVRLERPGPPATAVTIGLSVLIGVLIVMLEIEFGH